MLEVLKEGVRVLFPISAWDPLLHPLQDHLWPFQEGYCENVVELYLSSRHLEEEEPSHFRIAGPIVFPLRA